MELGKFYFLKEKRQENSQWVLVKCVVEETLGDKKTYYYKHFDATNVKFFGDVLKYDPDLMESRPFGSTPQQWDFAEQYWEQFL